MKSGRLTLNHEELPGEETNNNNIKPRRIGKNDNNKPV
jgi:hypothetical protein